MAHDSEQRINWYRTPLDKTVMKALLKRCNAKGLNAFFFGFISWTNTLRYRASRLEWLGYWIFDWKLFAGNLDILIRHSFGIIKGEWEHRLFPESDPKLRRKLFNRARLVLIGQLLIAAVIIHSGQWILLALFTFAPFIGGILAWAVLPQHAGLPPDTPDFRICLPFGQGQSLCPPPALANGLPRGASHVCRRALLQSQKTA